MISASRKNDAVISVYQNNQTRQVEVVGANAAAETLLGYPARQLTGSLLANLLPEEMRSDLESEIDYQPGGEDLASFLRRVRRFRVVNQAGMEIPVNLKVFYVPALDTNPRFELLLRDITLLEKMEELRREFNENRQTHDMLDAATGLLRTDSTLSNLQLMQEFVKEHRIAATVAVISIDNLPSPPADNQVLRVVGERFRQQFRAEDSIGSLPNQRLAVILFDCSAVDAMAVLGRVRDAISNDVVPLGNGQALPITVSIGYTAVTGTTPVTALLDTCQSAVQRAAAAGGGAIIAG